MDCQHARLLLSFRREMAALDRSEADDLKNHLEQCSDCAIQAGDEQRLDAALGPAMRAVPLPIGLQERLLARLPRPPLPWRRWAISAAAVAATFLIAAGIWWRIASTRDLPVNALNSPPMLFPALTRVDGNVGAELDKMQQWFDDQGLAFARPSDPEYQPAYLKAYTVGIFRGRQVPVLVFAQPGEAGSVRLAHVY